MLLSAGALLVKCLWSNSLFARSRVHTLRSNGRLRQSSGRGALVKSLVTSKSILSYFRVHLNLLLDQLHVFHGVRVDSVLDLRYVTLLK